MTMPTQSSETSHPPAKSRVSLKQKIAVYSIYWSLGAIVGIMMITSIVQQITISSTPPPSMQKAAFDAWCSRRILSAYERLEPQARPGRADVPASELTSLATLCASRSQHLAHAIDSLKQLATTREQRLNADEHMASQRDELLAMITRFSRGE